MAKINKVAPVTQHQGPSAKPGTKDEKAKKAPKRIEFSAPEGAAYVNADGKFTAVPTDWDAKKHQPLKRKTFADDSQWLELRAQDYDRRAAALRKQAVEGKKLGNVKDKAKAKKLLGMQKRMEDLRKQLEADGIDVAALLGAQAEKVEAAVEAAPAPAPMTETENAA